MFPEMRQGQDAEVFARLLRELLLRLGPALGLHWFRLIPRGGTKKNGVRFLGR